MDVKEIWKITLAQIEIKLDSPAQFKTWFKDTRLIEINGKYAQIGVRNGYTADWLRKRHNRLIKETISYVAKKDLLPKYVYDLEAAKVTQNQEENYYEESPILTVKQGMDRQTYSNIQQSGLNEKYTFENFVVGTSNRLAHAAAVSVADNPGKSYNPLFLYGGTGLGKTHLIQAVGRTILEKDPSKKVLYISSEGFLNDMVKAIRSNKGVEFRQKYRELDALIIDDIQFISKWQETQNEFFNTFNVLFHSNKQIVLASDRPPEEINKLEERLRSRFKGGIVVDISRPDFETRVAILENKKKVMGLEISEKVIKYLADIIRDNIRELEGALQKISLYNSMSPQELSIEEIAKILGKDSESKRKKLKLPKLLKLVADEFSVTVKDLKGPKRTKDIAFARQICMFLLREEFRFKYEQISQILNRSDHTTAIHAVDRIKSETLTNITFKEQLDNIIVTLQNQI